MMRDGFFKAHTNDIDPDDNRLDDHGKQPKVAQFLLRFRSVTRQAAPFLGLSRFCVPANLQNITRITVIIITFTWTCTLCAVEATKFTAIDKTKMLLFAATYKKNRERETLTTTTTIFSWNTEIATATAAAESHQKQLQRHIKHWQCYGATLRVLTSMSLLAKNEITSFWVEKQKSQILSYHLLPYTMTILL